MGYGHHFQNPNVTALALHILALTATTLHRVHLVSLCNIHQHPLAFVGVYHISSPIGSMYAIYGNIYHQYTPNVTIYGIHGSYGSYHIPQIAISIHESWENDGTSINQWISWNSCGIFHAFPTVFRAQTKSHRPACRCRRGDLDEEELFELRSKVLRKACGSAKPIRVWGLHWVTCIYIYVCM